MCSLICKLAWKNSLSRPSRTLLLIVLIAVSMSMMLLLQGLYDGMAESMIDKNRRVYSGDVSIFAKGYLIDKEIKDNIKDTKLLQELQNTQGVRAVTTRISVEGLLATARKSAFISLQGIELEQEKKFGSFGDFLKEGKLTLGKNSALIGLELAKKLKVKVGSKVVFSTQDSLGEIVSVVYRISGIVQTTNIVYDTRAVFVDQTKIQQLLALKEEQVTQVALMTGDQDLFGQLKKDIPSMMSKVLPNFSL